MDLNISRQFVLDRIAERISFIEDGMKKFEAHLKKLHEVDPKRYSDASRNLSLKTATDSLQMLRFMVEHLPVTPIIEMSLADCAMTGIIDPKTEYGLMGFVGGLGSIGGEYFAA